MKDIFRLSFDFDKFGSLLDFYEGIAQKNHPKLIGAMLKYHSNNDDKIPVRNHFVVSPIASQKEQENIVPLKKGGERK